MESFQVFRSVRVFRVIPWPIEPFGFICVYLWLRYLPFAKFGTDHTSARYQRIQLRARNSARKRGAAAVRRRDQAFSGHYLQRRAQAGGDLFRRLDLLAPHVDHADLYGLAGKHVEYRGGQIRLGQFERALGNPASRQCGKYFIVAVLPLLATALARAIAVTDMDAARHGHTLEGAVHRLRSEEHTSE